MLAALGGTIKIPDVCGGNGGCNQRFGDSIDRELLRNSTVTLHRLLLSKGQTHEQQMFFFREDHGVWLDIVRCEGERRVMLLPQLYMHGQLPVVVASSEYSKERMDLLRRPVEDLARAKMLIHEWDQSAPARIVFLPRHRLCVARARSETELAHFFDSIRAKLPELASRHQDDDHQNINLGMEKTPLVLCIGAAINEPARCAAKMAFNFLSYYLGPEVALRAEFDSVRQYITGENVDPVRLVAAESGEMGLSVDTRHAANWFATRPKTPRWRLLREAHYITLFAQNRVVQAEVGLFGGRSPFFLSFGRVGSDLVVSKPLPAVLLTPIAGGGDRVLADAELADALIMAEQHDDDGSVCSSPFRSTARA
jgi:hypothetical protein